ncbi:MAG: DUF4142 domain-containing protein [Gemmatimonadaceae bacterium]
MTTYRRAIISAVLLSAAASCRLLRPVDPNGPRSASPPAPEAVAPEAVTAQPEPAPQARAPEVRGRVNDANITAMLLASNNTDISYARLVPSRGQRDDVRKFAERMLTDHAGLNAMITDLIKRLDMDPKDNTISLDMRDESANKRDIMRELSGFAFDSTYMENEITYHQKFLATIDEIMMPAARGGELRNLLAVIRPAVAAHLAHAEQTKANVLAKK